MAKGDCFYWHAQNLNVFKYFAWQYFALEVTFSLPKKMAASQAAALLDELMGRDRNLAPTEKRAELRWDDPEARTFLFSMYIFSFRERLSAVGMLIRKWVYLLCNNNNKHGHWRFFIQRRRVLNQCLLASQMIVVKSKFFNEFMSLWPENFDVRMAFVYWTTCKPHLSWDLEVTLSTIAWIHVFIPI